MVDGQGRIVFGDQILQILAADVLTRHPGATIIADVKTSQTFFDEIARAWAAVPLMWKTGHSLIKAKMAEVGRAARRARCRATSSTRTASTATTTRSTSQCACSTSWRAASRTMTELKDAMPVAFNTPEVRFDCPEERKFAAIAEVKANLAKEGAQVERHRRRAGEDGRRLVAGAGLQHAGSTGGAGGGQLARGPGAAEGRGRLQLDRVGIAAPAGF